MKRSYGVDYDFCPQTFIFPEDYKKFLKERETDDTMYIMKPVASSRGRGIKVFAKASQITKRRYSN